MSVVEVRLQPIIRGYLYDGTNGQDIIDIVGTNRLTLALDDPDIPNGDLCLKMPFHLEPIPVGTYVTVTTGVTPGTYWGVVDGFTVLPG